MNAAERIAWLRQRQAGVGSSDAAPILGMSPYYTAADVYRDKTEPVDERAPTGFLRRGLDLEHVVAGMYEEATDETLMKPPPLVSPKRSWQAANIDRIRIADRNPVELKTTAGFGDEWGPAGSEQVPDAYAVQCQHQMGVVGSDWCDLAALDVIAWELRVYRIPFDAAFFARLTDREAEFWEYVQRREPLPQDWTERSPPVVKGKCIDLGPEVGELVAQRRELSAIAKEADVAKRHLEARITALMGDADKATAGPFTVKRINVKATHVPAHDKDAYSYIRCDITKGARV